MNNYGEQPRMVADEFIFSEWHEFMHYFYLPVKMRGQLSFHFPERLEFLRDVVVACAWDFVLRFTRDEDHRNYYVYVTVRHGYASPDNPLNRPGWHCDGFGTNDVNYVWSDRYPTRYAVHDFTDISADHVESLRQFEAQARPTLVYPDNALVALTPHVVHTTPEVPAPGGNRKFVKVSISKDKYNLLGNSHNYLLDYDWKMWDRSEIRNNPQFAGRDSVPE